MITGISGELVRAGTADTAHFIRIGDHYRIGGVHQQGGQFWGPKSSGRGRERVMRFDFSLCRVPDPARDLGPDCGIGNPIFAFCSLSELLVRKRPLSPSHPWENRALSSAIGMPPLCPFRSCLSHS